MTTTLYDYTYKDPSGYSYTGQVVADTTDSKYNYVSGQTYQGANGGTYTISGTGTPTNAPSGAVYQTSYTNASGTTYDSYHYDPKNNAYYDVNKVGYDKTTGMYTPPGSTPVPQWSGIGLGNEYSYVQTPDGSYHVYGGGGTANAQITPSTLGLTAWDYKFTYPDGSYYLGKVIDDGTYGYSAGDKVTKNGGTYDIYAKDATPPSMTALAGQNYTLLYHDMVSNTNYPVGGGRPTSP